MHALSDNKHSDVRAHSRPNPTLGPRAHPRRPRRAARGLVVIWAVVFLILILAFVSMGVEYAWLVDHQTRAQTAAEASSLAGVQKLGIGKSQALEDANSTALLNPGTLEGVILLGNVDNTGGDIVFGRWSDETGAFVPDLLASNAMKITVKFRDGHPNGPVSLIYGDLLGGYSDVSASATAHRRPVFPVPDRLWVLGNSSGTLTIRNDGLLQTTGACTIHSEQADAIVIENGGILEGTLIDVAGSVSFDSYKTVLGFLREQSEIGPGTGIEPPPDYASPPVESLDEQTYAEWTAVRLKPGHYPDGVVVSEGDYRLKDGLYRFGGPGLVLRGNASLTSTNALIYLDAGSDLVIDGASATLGGIVENGTNTEFLADWIGVALVGEPGAGGQQLTIRPSTSLTTTDIVYLPEGTIEVAGGSLELGTLGCETLSIDDDGIVLIGDQSPHPHEHLLVR